MNGVLKIGYWSKVPTDQIQYFLHPNGTIKAYNSRPSLMGSDLTDINGYYSISWEGSYQWYYVQFNYVSNFVKVYEYESENEFDDLYYAAIAFLPGNGGNKTINFELQSDQSNVFYHVNKAHDYYKNTFNYNAMDYQVKAVLKVGSFHNAAINEDDEMIFGSQNGVQWARYSDVIYHEYFHLVHRKLIGSPVYNYLTKGLADYFACTINNDSNYGENTSSNSNRQLLNTIQYSPGANQYLNGQALSGACWDIREELGSTIADQLVFRALQLNPNPSSVDDFADNIKKIDFQYYNSSYQNIIVSAFANHSITVRILSTPTSLSITESSNEYALLSWTANTESDLKEYNVYRKGGYPIVDWAVIGTTTSTSYEDTEVTTTYRHGEDFFYKITAVDIYDYESGYSNEVEIEARLEKQHMEENLDANPKEYSLNSNYPNPFNPTTQISYQIPKDGFVSLVVYNSLGQEVITLVSKHQSSGNYAIQFNATSLPSGVYIYKLTVNGFSSTKKMILSK